MKLHHGSSSSSGKVRKTEVLASGTTWTKPNDVTEIELVIAQAGGGGGGNHSGAGGGGAGGAIVRWNYAVSGDITYAIGAGGAGGTDNGAAGGNTTWDGLTVTGGAGAQTVNNAHGASSGSTPNLSSIVGPSVGTGHGFNATATGPLNGFPMFGVDFDCTGATGGAGNTSATGPGDGGNCGPMHGGNGYSNGADDFGGGGASLLANGGDAQANTAKDAQLGAGGGASTTHAGDGGDGVIILMYWSAT